MQNETQTTEQIARDRVANSAALDPYADAIWNDWDNMDEHLQWVATAPESEIIEWAQQIKRDA